LNRCPSDLDVKDRQRQWEKSPKGPNPYLYSYSLTSYVDAKNHGLGSLYQRGQPPEHFKSAYVKNPALKLMLVDENSDIKHDPNSTIDDGRWVPPDNTITARHRFRRGLKIDPTTFLRKGKGTVLFVEGHVETVAPQIGKQPDNYDAIR
jgi:hypothetical protein